jgi:cyclic pyranopterin phosphate synthase
MDEPNALSHVDDAGRARMVDVSQKAETYREAVAECRVEMSPGVIERVVSGNLPKGAVLETARLAGIMGAKRTSDLIPMCHPLRLSEVRLEFETLLADQALVIRATVVAVDRTGVEMEAMVAASVAALTVYDMVKAVDKRMVIRSTRLLRKVGGKSGLFEADAP